NRPARRRPVRRDDGADERRPRHRAPAARVARAEPVVAHDEVLALAEPRPRLGHRVALVEADVRLAQLPAVDVGDAGTLGDLLARQPDHPPQVGASLRPPRLRPRRPVDAGHLAAYRTAEAAG